MGERWLEPSEWDAAVCAELRPALTLLEQRYGARIEKVHLDMKASMTDVYLAGQPPAGVIAWLESTLPPNEHLRFWPKGAVSGATPRPRRSERRRSRDGGCGDDGGASSTQSLTPQPPIPFTTMHFFSRSCFLSPFVASPSGRKKGPGG